VGDIKAADALPMLEKYFGAIPAGPKPPQLATVEPPQVSERTVVIHEPTQPVYMEGYHRPDYRSPDDSVYDAISDILSNGRTGRLYRSLVRDQKIAQSVGAGSGDPGVKYPNLFEFSARPLPGHTNQEMAEAIHKELERLKTTDVTDEELAAFKTRNRVDTLRGLADNEGLASQLAEYQTLFGDWRALFTELDKADKVTKADIRRVANQIFVPTNRTTAEIEFQAPTSPAASSNGGAQ
jgi:predicted Zn-dependent peptidase